MYYIYHIPGKKIGCTKNVDSRLRQQNSINYEILETHTDIHIASQREIELQKQYGYKVDKTTYYNSTKEFSFLSCSATFSKVGFIVRHGPHHFAWKSIITLSPFLIFSFNFKLVISIII